MLDCRSVHTLLYSGSPSKGRQKTNWCLGLITLVLLSACSPVEDPSLFPAYDPNETASPPAKAPLDPNPLRSLLWGDLHIHTSYSTDAFAMGVKATPEDAYIFTRGGTIEHGAGYPIRIDRPLDFAAVTDHAEYLGAARADRRNTLPLAERGLRERLLNDGPLSLALVLASIARKVNGDALYADVPGVLQISQGAWQDTIETADAHYEPGVFTTFVGYEWTSMPEGQNLHRNIIYRGNDVPAFPFSSLDSEDPRELWNELDRQRAQGKEVLAIPHNGNVSNGLMYDRVQYDGSAITQDYADQRLRNEPISEIMQIKGASETHPLLSPEDEFANFEIMSGLLTPWGEEGQASGSYARDALRTGIEFSHAEGFNPYRFGVIGSSDSHNASSSPQESKHHGKLPLMDGTAGLRLGESMLLPASMHRARQWGSAGLAGVWATENTREAIFDALRRRETFATSGPRISLRFFAGFELKESLMQHNDAIAIAYAQGVPMGSVLPVPDSSSIDDRRAPGFFIWAAKDPRGANLDRVQIIKAWVDASGESHEKIFDVAFSTDREPAVDGEPEADGKLAPVGNTVYVRDASYSNTIGDAQLSAFWQDPDFDPALKSFYYARVIEIPTPRWSTYDARALGVAAPEPASIQERAISSAIWYPGYE